MKFGLEKMGCSIESSSANDIPCNGRGECSGPKGNETCICEIKFTGDFCSNFNKTYHAGESWEIIGMKIIICARKFI
jgi:hypothetical protein